MRQVKIEEQLIKIPDSAKRVSIRNGKIWADHKIVADIPSTKVILITSGDILNLDVGEGDVTIKGDVKANVCLSNGNLRTNSIGGYASVNGNISCEKVGMGIRAGGSVYINGVKQKEN